MFICNRFRADGNTVGQRDTLMSRGKNCRETIFVSRLSRKVTLTTGVILKEEKMPSLVVERQFWSQFLLRDIKVSRRALWEVPYKLQEFPE